MNAKVSNVLTAWGHHIGWLVFVSALIMHISSCQTYKGEDRENGKYKQSGLRLDLPGNKMDMDLLSHRERVLSPEEHKEEMRRKAEEEKLRIELEANEKERLYKIETKEKKRRILLWLSLGCYVLSVIAVILGILLEGWKVFSTISIAMMGFGVFFMILIDMLPVMTIIIVIPIAIGVVRAMYMFKHIALNKKSEEKAAAKK